MKWNRIKWKRMFAIGMIAAVTITTTSISTSSAAQNETLTHPLFVTDQGTATISNKSEVVYAKLSANGTTDAVYVVNHFEVEKAGMITDYGDYESVQNLTEIKPITQEGDIVSFEALEGNFYYQGNLKSTELPWNFDITYTLDGVAQSASDIAGKSGELTITITSTQNLNITHEFYENYMLQISLTLDNEKCSNINAPEAIIAEAGNNTMLNFTVMPKNNADIQVTADVTNFTMNGVELSAMPFSMSMDLPDMDQMLEGFDQLPIAISELNDGVGKLAEGASLLKTGAMDIKNGSSVFKDGLSGLKLNSTQITGASSQINEALATISKSLTMNPSDSGLSDLSKLPVMFHELSAGIQGIAGGLNELKGGYSSAYTALDLAIQAIPDSGITQEFIKEQFPNTSEAQLKLLDQLYTSYIASQTVKGTYQQVKQAFAVVEPTLDTLSANLITMSKTLDGVSSQIGTSMSENDLTSQLELLSQGLTELATNYSEFNQGLTVYMEGVGKLSDGYNQFDSGLLEFVTGVETLDQGVASLHEGTQQFQEETSNMPAMIQEEIDQLVKDYTGSEFADISFISSKNTNTGLVQFVLKCEDIQIPEVGETTDAVVADSKQEETVLDRLVALFIED